ncbi:hypothetical protein PLESTB_000967600 [Pleodorina starrii]|uniref:Uncharacterized protein n=1 Tax=Pleodorina starrii TaxID=330485 RepID=A0A9W6BPR2_9CHLO|nr:hypothetical protein PLESTB_000967600 [Pleodorina starrii]
MKVAAPPPEQELARFWGPLTYGVKQALLALREACKEAKTEHAKAALYAGAVAEAMRAVQLGSVAENIDFVRSDIQKALALGVVARWTPDIGRPTVINGLRIVLSQGGKKRHSCVNPV